MQSLVTKSNRHLLINLEQDENNYLQRCPGRFYMPTAPQTTTTAVVGHGTAITCMLIKFDFFKIH